MNSSTCILVPTVEPYLKAARLTRRLLDAHWRDHPEVFLCGVTAQEPNALALLDDPRDWMAIVRRAVVDLAARGFTKVYLILDDQGPMDSCHDAHLNTTIPNWMDELGAIYISIRGWDHRRNSSGRHLGKRWLYLQRQHADYKWRFALHPALWRIDALTAILDAMMVKRTELQERTAWAFEEGAGALGDRIPLSWHHGTYRVCGRAMMVEPMPTLKRLRRHLIDGAVRKINAVVESRKFGTEISRRVVSALRTEAVYYHGPYPMHFSGFLVRGHVNRHLSLYLARKGRDDLLMEISQAAPISD